MKRVLFVGLIALGSMSFVGTENIQIEEGNVDCFAQANQAVEILEAMIFLVRPETADMVWTDAFYSCSAINGQLLEDVVIE